MSVKNLGLCLRPDIQKALDKCGESNSCSNSKYYHYPPWDEVLTGFKLIQFLHTKVLGAAAIAVSWSGTKGIVARLHEPWLGI